MEYNECTPDEIGKAVHQAAIAAFERSEPGCISVQDLIEERQRFTPANIADPVQISNIRLHSRFYEKAASQDNSIFAVEDVEEFKLLRG
jgi:hypothetical protein